MYDSVQIIRFIVPVTCTEHMCMYVYVLHDTDKKKALDSGLYKAGCTGGLLRWIGRIA